MLLFKRREKRRETGLSLGDIPDEARVTAGHRHSKTYNTAFIVELNSPHRPAALQRTFLEKSSFLEMLSPLPVLSVICTGD